MSSGLKVERQGIITEKGCHEFSVKKLHGLNNCSITGKEKIFLNGSGKKINRIYVGSEEELEMAPRL